ncbi:MAG: integrase domain-containing protein [Candidatus Thiothrix putei]|uniref:Integrase n=2 Tax=Thiothrix TaxID=1030 RepID=A0A1H4DV59_9GAMM|nr:integrase domain-containing protein [Thiothrix caldifontis]WGZ92960.1 MAG: integrase domain-containing protein [Candidatus Thiothrix putei]SEA76487.1 Integrase [Thiothrix caldifontis]
MGKFTSGRNFGYGKSMSYAASQALKEHYGEGHFNAVAAHQSRFSQFADYLKTEEGIRDAKDITQDAVERYGQQLNEKVAAGEMAVSYAQNLLSSVNTTLACLRGDESISVSPSGMVGERSHVRTVAPDGLDRTEVRTASENMRHAGLERAAAVTELAREFGLREREAILGNLERWHQEAKEKGAINVTEGTKGGRGHEVDRWVPVSQTGLQTLERAIAASPEGSRNLLATHEIYISFVHGELNKAREHLKEAGIGKYHELRAAYACERYEQLTGHLAPVLGDGMSASRESDREAREILTEELGHGRIDVVSAYIGGRS